MCPITYEMKPRRTLQTISIEERITLMATRAKTPNEISKIVRMNEREVTKIIDRQRDLLGTIEIPVMGTNLKPQKSQ